MDLLPKVEFTDSQSAASVAERLREETLPGHDKFRPSERAFQAPGTARLELEDVAGQLWNMRSGLRESIKEVCFAAAEGQGKSKEISSKHTRWEWITAVNLTTDFSQGNEKKGVAQRVKELTEFAAKTKGSNVALIVQAAFPDEPKPNESTDKESSSEKSKTTYHLDRYLISNGTISKIETIPSAGYGKDLESLLQYTTTNYRCKKLALIVDSHGQGNQGLSGDTGDVSLAEFHQAISSGLKGRHKSLDVLNFDCCLMAQDGMVKVMAPVAKEIVASTSKIMVEGQNLVRTLDKLVQSPQMNGHKLADAFVETVRQEAPGPKEEDRWTTVRTFAHFKSEKQKAFQSELDDLGDYLCAALDKEKTRDAINKVLDDTRRFNDWGDSAHEWDTGNTADLKYFLQGLRDGIKSGLVPDENGVLTRSIDRTMTRMNRFVVAYFGDSHHNEFDKQGGLSVYLPKRSIRDNDIGARLRSPAGSLARMAEKCCQGFTTNDERTDLLKDCKDGIKELMAETNAPVGVDKELKAINEAYAKLEKSTTKQDFTQAAKDFAAACRAMEQTPHFLQRTKADKEQLQKETKELYKAHLVSDDHGWGRFQLKLRDAKNRTP
jgi:hypothetical protein